MDYLEEAKNILTVATHGAADASVEAVALIAIAHALIALADRLDDMTGTIEDYPGLRTVTYNIKP